MSFTNVYLCAYFFSHCLSEFIIWEVEACDHKAYYFQSGFYILCRERCWSRENKMILGLFSYNYVQREKNLQPWNRIWLFLNGLPQWLLNGVKWLCADMILLIGILKARVSTFSSWQGAKIKKADNTKCWQACGVI